MRVILILALPGMFLAFIVLMVLADNFPELIELWKIKLTKQKLE